MERPIKKSDVRIGEVYVARISGKLTRVRIDREANPRGWWGTNLNTKREIRIKSAAKLRLHIPNGSILIVTDETEIL